MDMANTKVKYKRFCQECSAADQNVLEARVCKTIVSFIAVCMSCWKEVSNLEGLIEHSSVVNYYGDIFFRKGIALKPKHGTRILLKVV